tara:strand:- start:2422 stop:2643 length:222 start_codon:yes stop_codon:yes gene_type:complete
MKFNIIHEKSLDFFVGQKVHLAKNHVNYGYGIIEKLNPKKAVVKIYAEERRFKIDSIVHVEYDYIEKVDEDEN